MGSTQGDIEIYLDGHFVQTSSAYHCPSTSGGQDVWIGSKFFKAAKGSVKDVELRAVF